MIFFQSRSEDPWPKLIGKIVAVMRTIDDVFYAVSARMCEGLIRHSVPKTSRNP